MQLALYIILVFLLILLTS